MALKRRKPLQAGRGTAWPNVLALIGCAGLAACTGFAPQLDDDLSRVRTNADTIGIQEPGGRYTLTQPRPFRGDGAPPETLEPARTTAPRSILSRRRSAAMRALDANLSRTEIDPEAFIHHDLRVTQLGRGVAIDNREEVTLNPDILAGTTRLKADLGEFGEALWNDLKDQVVGYTVLVSEDGQIVHEGRWGWARTPLDGGHPWEADTKMHVASLSKLFTAIAMVEVLNQNDIPIQSPIGPWLPDYWTLGANSGSVTFEMLLQNRAGWGTGNTDFLTMRRAVANGIADNMLGNGSYENMNCGLMRILIPIIEGRVRQDALADSAPANSETATWHDNWWDSMTISAYRTAMKEHVFTPAEVYTPALHVLNAPGYSALAYNFPVEGNGRLSEDLDIQSGGVGWVVSPEQAAKVLSALNEGELLSEMPTLTFLMNLYGLDGAVNSPLGPIFHKNGRWTIDNQTEQTVGLITPDNREVVVFVNSWIGAQNGPAWEDGRQGLRGTVWNHYIDAMTR